MVNVSDLRLVYWNVGSGWVDKMRLSCISIYFEEDSPIDIIVIAEPWVHRLELPLVLVSGWTLFHSLHPTSLVSTSRYGGILLYIRDSLMPCFSLVADYNDTCVDIIVFSFCNVVFSAVIFLLLPPVSFLSPPQTLWRYWKVSWHTTRMKS